MNKRDINSRQNGKYKTKIHQFTKCFHKTFVKYKQKKFYFQLRMENITKFSLINISFHQSKVLLKIIYKLGTTEQGHLQVLESMTMDMNDIRYFLKSCIKC